MIVYYHSPCADGFCAWWLFQKVHPEATGIGINYPGDVDYTACQDQEVWCLDWTPPDMDRLASVALRVTVLDHHKSAIDRLEGRHWSNVELVMDVKYSGAMLVSRHLGIGSWVVDYVQDRDLWKWELPDSRIIGAAIAALPMDFTAWDVFRDQGPARAKMYGFGVLQCNERILERMPVVVRGDIAWVNSPVLQSEIGDRLSREVKLVCIWHYHNGGFLVSCRSRDGSALEFAKANGGGGHANAAGYETCNFPVK